MSKHDEFQAIGPTYDFCSIRHVATFSKDGLNRELTKAESPVIGAYRSVKLESPVPKANLSETSGGSIVVPGQSTRRAAVLRARAGFWSLQRDGIALVETPITAS
jgi:hypothetical protein